MKELSITVMQNGASDASYRFLDSPVLIGRSPECDLCILHESVPRELCLAWLEDNGKTVRVEERPGLTNQLLKGQNVVRGGHSDRLIEVSVGPIKLRLEPAFDVDEENPKKRASKPKIRFFAIALIMGLCSLTIVNLNKPARKSNEGPHLLPSSPFCRPESTDCESLSGCEEKARLYVTRARELLSRPQKKPADQVRAASMFAMAAKIYIKTKSDKADTTHLEAEDATKKAMIAYQKETMALKRTHKTHGPQDAATLEAASRVHEYLHNCHGPWRPWLNKLNSLSMVERSKKSGHR